MQVGLPFYAWRICHLGDYKSAASDRLKNLTLLGQVGEKDVVFLNL